MQVRSVRPSPAASASGRRSNACIAANPLGEISAPSAQAAHAPPAPVGDERRLRAALGARVEVRLVPGQPQQLSWKASASGSSAGRRDGPAAHLPGELEEAEQRPERALVRLLLGEEPEHRLRSDERDAEPVGILARLAVRSNQVDRGDRLQLAPALVQLELDVRAARAGRPRERVRRIPFDRPDPAAVERVEMKHPIRFTEADRAEDDRLRPVRPRCHRLKCRAGCPRNPGRGMFVRERDGTDSDLYDRVVRLLRAGQDAPRVARARLRGDRARRRPRLPAAAPRATGGWTVPQIVVDGELIGGYRTSSGAWTRRAFSTAARRPERQSRPPRRRSRSWQGGQYHVPRPATRVFSIGVPQRSHGSPARP